MKLLSLFSGIGAFEKALDKLNIGYELEGFSEIDKPAIKSYCAIHSVEETKNLGDITKIDENALSKDIDLITYGFPCQDISLAGKQKGLFNADGTQTRSGLFFEALRIIESTQPKIAIAENVKNLTSKKFSEQFKIVLDSLAEAGYNNYWQVLNAKDYGIPQNRERVFIISVRKDIDTGIFNFPNPFPLNLRLKDMLEDTVDEKYYISDSKIAKIINSNFMQEKTRIQFGNVCGTLLARDYKDPKCVPVESKVIVREATRTGFAEAFEGDSINLEHPNSKTRRGRVGRGVAQTLTTSPQQAIVESFGIDKSKNNPRIIEVANCITAREDRGISNRRGEGTAIVEPKINVIGNYSPSGHDASRIVSTDRLAPTVKENHGTVTAIAEDLRIRKLTPKECFRLQGFDDESFYKAAAVNSNSQLYKQAGNSIVVDVLCYIINGIYEAGILKHITEE